MNRRELEEILLENCVPPHTFSFDVVKYDGDTFCLIQTGKIWKILYTERNILVPVKEFDTEQEACEFLYQDFKKRYGFIENAWSEISSFNSYGQCASLEKHLQKELLAGTAKEIPVFTTELLPADFVQEERWFEQLKTHKIWRLARPENPFWGFWKTL